MTLIGGRGHAVAPRRTTPHNRGMGFIEWLAEVGSGLYALTASLVVLGGFVVFIIEMAGKALEKRRERPTVNVYVGEAHVHVHLHSNDEVNRDFVLPQSSALPPTQDSDTESFE